MVKLTIVGRVEDGLPLAQDQTYLNQQDNASFLFYNQQAEFILKQICKDSFLHSKMTILLDHHSFHFLVEKKICYIVLSDSSYPRKLLFHYLQDLQKEFDNLDETVLINTISKPYSFVRFSKIIGRIRKQYMDTRTQANLSKLNASRNEELDVITEHLNDLIQRRQLSEIGSLDPRMSVSTIRSSRCLQVYEKIPDMVHHIRTKDIALKWTPVTIIVFVILVLFKASLIMTDDYLISTTI